MIERNLAILSLEDRESWETARQRIPGLDLHYSPGYLAAFAGLDASAARCALYTDSDGSLVLYPYFVRSLSQLSQVPTDLTDRCDIASPYGYSGPIAKADSGSVDLLMFSFRRAFDAYLRETGIVSEFVRFHPLLANHAYMVKHLDSVRAHSDNPVISLEADDAALLARCRPRYRTGIRRALQRGISVERVALAVGMVNFVDAYRTTMRRHQARPELDFSRAFFDKLYRELGNHLSLFVARKDGELLSASLFVEHPTYIDYFLTANPHPEFNEYANHLLIMKACMWARDAGFTKMHLGGGSASLMQFKEGFSDMRARYWVGYKVHDRPAYERLAAAAAALQPNAPSDNGFFPLYRSPRD